MYLRRKRGTNFVPKVKNTGTTTFGTKPKKNVLAEKSTFGTKRGKKSTSGTKNDFWNNTII